MEDLKIILNIFYEPTEELKTIIENNKNIYIPINGGSTLIENDWCKNNLYFDNAGENISKLNNILNEFTSIYWVWKHYEEIGNPSYIGFAHYRRLFPLELIKDYKNYDGIFIKSIIHKSATLKYAYESCHIADDLKIFYEILKNVFPEHTIQPFFNYLEKSHEFYAPYNMFILKKELFFNYVKIIFKLIPLLIKKIDLKNRTKYQARAICFLMERFFSWYALCLSSVYKTKQVQVEKHLNFKPYDLSTENEKLLKLFKNR